MAGRKKKERVFTGVPISVLYERDGKVYRHLFKKPNIMVAYPDKVVIEGDLKVTKTRGII